ncbi:winged helix DNA-binding domain-containing protein [Gorillibacterium massiliense]|uniref:winged helix DNA-binding domain-containing protein n=1 Tax=Gorillibacterium massiliense TaxID=1280390 RepID=UPI0004BA5A51|nr:winged helix DNA-binding domain-containing protein [Gorillibacterium massiliense]
MKETSIGMERLRRQHLAGSVLDKPEQIVRSLGAMQAQDYHQAVWAVGSRMGNVNRGLSDVINAIAEGKIILSWSLRGTIHLMAAEDAGWMIKLSGQRIANSGKRRLAELELDDGTLERCRTILYKALAGGQRVDRPSLMQRLEQEGISTAGQRGYHILWHSAYEGLICFGPVIVKQQSFVLVEEWVKERRELSREESLVELARRYYSSHGPATVQDFAWWSGMTLTDARTGLDGAKRELAVETVGGCEYWRAKELCSEASSEQSVYLLAGFDEYLLGYKDRSAVLAPENAPQVAPGNNGIFLPLMVREDGQVMGTWKRMVKKKGLEVELNPFTPIDGYQKDLAAKAAEDYAAFMGLPLLKIV